MPKRSTFSSAPRELGDALPFRCLMDQSADEFAIGEMRLAVGGQPVELLGNCAERGDGDAGNRGIDLLLLVIGKTGERCGKGVGEDGCYVFSDAQA